MSSANQVQIRRVREATVGTLPAGNMTVIPMETFQFSAPMQREVPGNVVPDRQPRDNPATDLEPTGSGGSDFLLGIYEELMEEAFCKVFTAAVTIGPATDIAAAAAGNKLTKTAGGWGALADGDIIFVSGFDGALNPAAFVALVSGTVTATDLPLAWPTLQTEAVGDSVTVDHKGQLVLGSDLLTASYEEWNVKSSKGKQYPGVGVTKFGVEVPFPNRCRLSWQLRGMKAPTRLSAQLANGTITSPSRKVINSNSNFGDKTLTGGNMGLRYNGVLMPSLRVSRFSVTVENPLLAAGGAGVLGPQDIALDGEFAVRVELQAYRDGADVDTLIDDANNPDAVKSIGIGFRDGDVNRDYLYLDQLQASNERTSGVAKSGREMVDVSFVSRFQSVHSMIRWAKLSRP